jgi:hypothetical protein
MKDVNIYILTYKGESNVDDIAVVFVVEVLIFVVGVF